MRSSVSAGHMVENTLVIIGVSFRSATVDVREHFLLDESCYAHALEKLIRCEAVDEVAVISTCNRTEFLVWTPDASRAASSILRYLTREHNLTLSEWSSFYRHVDDAALLHLLRVASGLDSLVFGEADIAARIEFALKEGAQSGAVGRCLEAVVSKALAVARRVQTETAIGQNPVVNTLVPVELARQACGGLKNRSLVMIGSEELSLRLAEEFSRAGIGSIDIASHETVEAAKLAARISASFVPSEPLRKALRHADIVLTCTPGARFLLQRSELAEWMRTRAGRELVIIDTAMPRNVDAAARDIPGLTLYNVDDLNGFVERNGQPQHAAVVQAEKILRNELLEFRNQLAGPKADPLISEVHSRLERLCREELLRLNEELGPFTEDQHHALNALSEHIIQRVMSSLSRRLEEPDAIDQATLLNVLRSPLQVMSGRNVTAGRNK